MLIFSCAKADALVKMHLYWDFLSWKKTLISFKVWVLYIVKFYSECVRMVKRSLYLFFEQWSHSKKRKNILSDFLPFDKFSTVPWLILLLFQARTIPMIRENGNFLAVILGQFLPFVQLKYWKLSGALPQHSRAIRRHSQSQNVQCIFNLLLIITASRKKLNLPVKKGHNSWPLPPSHSWFLTTFVYLVVSRHISTI